MSVNLDEWRSDAEMIREQHNYRPIDVLARRLIAACKALEAYQDGVRAFRAGDPSSAALAFAEAEAALAPGDKA